MTNRNGRARNEPAPRSEHKVSSDRVALQDHADPAIAARYLATLMAGTASPGRLDPGLSYIASLLRRHVSLRQERVAQLWGVVPGRFEATARAIAMEMHHVASLAERIESLVGELVVELNPSPEKRCELSEVLQEARDHLASIRSTEIEVAMSRHWDDIGGSG